MICTLHRILLGRLNKEERYGQVFMACMGDRRGAQMVFVCGVMERDHLEDLGLDGS
jgi:hypothetical protein